MTRMKSLIRLSPGCPSSCSASQQAALESKGRHLSRESYRRKRKNELAVLVTRASSIKPFTAVMDAAA
jgi:hypothetical protein